MRTAEIRAPERLEEALALKAEHGDGIRVLAGGTDLIPSMRAGACVAERLLDLSRTEGLDEIREIAGEVYVGALVTHAACAASPIVRTNLPILAEACGLVGSAQIRSRGTVGGNLANASPAGDSIPALRVLGTLCEIRSQGGKREVPIEDFSTAPGETCLAPDEILVGVRVRKIPSGARWFYRKLGQRRAMAIAKVSVAFLAREKNRILSDVRIALGAVAPSVVGAPRTARYLEGRKLDAETIAEAARLIQGESCPIADVRSTAEYRREMVGVLLARGLLGLVE